LVVFICREKSAEYWPAKVGDTLSTSFGLVIEQLGKQLPHFYHANTAIIMKCTPKTNMTLKTLFYPYFALLKTRYKNI
jgi:hypothetical protein